MPDYIRTIIESAIYAPSGENSQPWEFAVEGNTIVLYNAAKRDESLYNYAHRGSYIAHGAAIENMVIAAAHVGFTAHIELFPDQQRPNVIAKIQLETTTKPTTSTGPDITTIKKRVTNRKPYYTTKIPEDVLTQLSTLSTSKCVRLSIITDSEAIKTLGQFGSTNEEIMLANKSLHQFFFSHLSWNKKMDTQKKVGFFIDTLELPLPARIIFRAVRFWPIMSFLNIFKFPHLVAHTNAQTNQQAPAMGVLSITDTQPTSFIEAGRALQRIWLTLTQHNIYLQPLSGTIFLNFFLEQQTGDLFSKKQIHLLKKSMETLYTITDIKDETITFLFRMGYSDAPSAHSSRFTVDALTTTIDK